MSAREDASVWLNKFAEALAANDIPLVCAQFQEGGFWRDLVAFTWNIATLEGREQIGGMLGLVLSSVRPSAWALDGVPISTAPGSIETWLSFETTLGRGVGYVRLVEGRCWTLLTALKELKGFEEPLGHRRRLGTEPATLPGNVNWLDLKLAEEAELGDSRQPDVLIVGGGQAGLALGARLKMLHVPTIIIDRHARAGDQWRSRYRSLTLHDPVWYDHMPYMPFPDHWPVFTPKDKIGDWMEIYAKVMELNLWTSTECVSAAYDEAKRHWDVVVNRGGRRVVVHPKQLVLATGNAGRPNLPKIKGAEEFRGQRCHSSQYSVGREFSGKRVVVIGSNNSAHDICEDLSRFGADVTMLQRSSALVVKSKTLMEMTLAPLYSQEAAEGGITTEKADLLLASLPVRVLPDIQRPIYEEIARRDAQFYEALQRVGFMLDFGEDGSGLFLKYLRRASGYYIDVGASDRIADGRIKLRSRVGIERIVPDGILLDDGSKLEADAIIYATGFGSMDQWAAELISPAVAKKVGPCWGYGSGTARDPGPWEGELRNMWKPTRQDGLWFHGGNLHQVRHYSLYLALQLKARQQELPVKVFSSPEAEREKSFQMMNSGVSDPVTSRQIIV